MRFLSHAKRSYITRNVRLEDAFSLSSSDPIVGDLLLARVDRIRQHTRLENTEGRRVHLYPGDEIIVAAGNRYATAQYHAESPSQLGPCHLVAAGGLAANMVSKSSQVKPATEITLLGTLADEAGEKLNLSRYTRLKPAYLHPSAELMPVLLVIGSDMNSGKTTLACSAINSFRNAGMRVAGAKLTGTGAGPDYWKMLDAGAFQVKDFVDAGMPSTAGIAEEQLINVLRTIKADAVQNDADVLVVEVADGVFQPETRALLAGRLASEVTGALVAADSAAAAVMTTERIIHAGIPVYSVGGVFTRSALCCDEVGVALGLPVHTLNGLREIDTVEYLKSALMRDHSDVAACVI